MSSGRRRVSKFSGPSVTRTSAAIAMHAARQPDPAISHCSHGRMMIAPTPTPENAMPIASPRRRTNQFGRKSACPV
jgi:hypothetical protein